MDTMLGIEKLKGLLDRNSTVESDIRKPASNEVEPAARSGSIELTEAYLSFFQPGDACYGLAQDQLARMESPDKLRIFNALDSARERYEQACPGDVDYPFADQMLEAIEQTVEMVRLGQDPRGYPYKLEWLPGRDSDF